MLLVKMQIICYNFELRTLHNVMSRRARYLCYHIHIASTSEFTFDVNRGGVVAKI